MIVEPILWTSPAMHHLHDLHSCLAESSIAAADSQLAIVFSATTSLAQFPEKGRPGRRRGTRELVVLGTPCIVAYRVAKRSITILAVIHGARRWARNLGA